MTSRRNFLRTTALAAGYAGFYPRLLATSSPAGTYHTLRGNVGYFVERGGTIGCYLTPENAVVVDTQFPESASNLLLEIRKVQSGPLDLLINTHHHGDHTAGNSVFRGITGKVVSHENCRKNLERTAAAQNTLDKTVLADTVFTTHWEMTLSGGEKISCQYFGRGHTDGDIVVHFEGADVAHIGDLVFNRRFPYIDVPGGASIDHWVDTLEAILGHYGRETLFLCGHAREGFPVVVGPSDLRAMQDYLRKLRDYAKGLIRDGVGEEEAVKRTTAIPGADEWIGEGVARSIRAAYALYQKS